MHKQKDLLKALNDLLKAENLNRFCSACKSIGVTLMKKSFASIPSVFIVILQRKFSWNSDDMSIINICPDITLNSIDYQLKSSTNHTGDFKSGHYSAVCNFGDKYYNCDESMVTLLSDSERDRELSLSCAVIYEKKDLDNSEREEIMEGVERSTESVENCVREDENINEDDEMSDDNFQDYAQNGEVSNQHDNDTMPTPHSSLSNAEMLDNFIS